MLPFEDYSVEIPHLIHTANSTMVDIILENMTTSDTFAKPRFALEIIFLRNDDDFHPMMVKMRKGLDDEHTPGIFEVRCKRIFDNISKNILSKLLRLLIKAYSIFTLIISIVCAIMLFVSQYFFICSCLLHLCYLNII